MTPYRIVTAENFRLQMQLTSWESVRRMSYARITVSEVTALSMVMINQILCANGLPGDTKKKAFVWLEEHV